MDEISKDFRKKFIVDGGGLVANFVNILALLLIATGVSTPAGVALLAVAVAIRLGLTAYNDCG